MSGQTQHDINFVIKYTRLPSIVTSSHGANTDGGIAWKNTGFNLSLNGLSMIGWNPIGFYAAGY